jgi:hypothetical protein
VVQAVTPIAAVLDDENGPDRHADADLGGYVLVLEGKEELEQLKDIHIDVDTAVPEYVDRSAVSGGSAYTTLCCSWAATSPCLWSCLYQTRRKVRYSKLT